MKRIIVIAVFLILILPLLGCGTQSYDESYEVGYQQGYAEGHQEGIEESKYDLPQVELPDIKLPDVELPAIKIPNVKLPDISTNITPNNESSSTSPASETSVGECCVNPEWPITMKLIVLGKSGDSYRYRTVLEEKSGANFHITALTREFVETGYTWTGGRDYVLDHLGSYTIPANGKLEWETSFDLSEV
ncbi:hypothetical protein ACFLWG_00830, partial [Chloroflexota bacterium]